MKLNCKWSEVKVEGFQERQKFLNISSFNAIQEKMLQFT
jgi:hypothetical protein